MECPTHQLPWLACHSTALPLAGMQLCMHMYKPICLQPRTVVLWLFLQLCKGNSGRPWMEAIALVYTLHIIFPELASVSLFCSNSHVSFARERLHIASYPVLPLQLFLQLGKNGAREGLCMRLVTPSVTCPDIHITNNTHTQQSARSHAPALPHCSSLQEVCA